MRMSNINKKTLYLILAISFLNTAIYSYELNDSISENVYSRKLAQNESKDKKGQGQKGKIEVPVNSCDNQGSFPYFVSIKDKYGVHLCGGTVIRKNAVLTSAHCLDRRVFASATSTPELSIGGVALKSPIEVRSTVKAFFHEGWKSDVLQGDDLVILKLDEPTCVRPVKYLGMYGMHDKLKYFFFGYGRVSSSSPPSELLQGGYFYVVNRDKCNAKYEFDPPLDKKQVCVQGHAYLGVCPGDDGGPLIYRQNNNTFEQDVLVAISSFTTSKKCTEDGAAAFTKIVQYRQWIKDTLASPEFNAAE